MSDTRNALLPTYKTGITMMNCCAATFVSIHRLINSSWSRVVTGIYCAKNQFHRTFTIRRMHTHKNYNRDECDCGCVGENGIQSDLP